jgi:hypothetical protein
MTRFSLPTKCSNFSLAEQPTDHSQALIPYDSKAAEAATAAAAASTDSTIGPTQSSFERHESSLYATALMLGAVGVTALGHHLDSLGYDPCRPKDDIDEDPLYRGLALFAVPLYKGAQSLVDGVTSLLSETEEGSAPMASMNETGSILESSGRSGVLTAGVDWLTQRLARS